MTEDEQLTEDEQQRHLNRKVKVLQAQVLALEEQIINDISAAMQGVEERAFAREAEREESRPSLEERKKLWDDVQESLERSKVFSYRGYENLVSIAFEIVALSLQLSLALAAENESGGKMWNQLKATLDMLITKWRHVSADEEQVAALRRDFGEAFSNKLVGKTERLLENCERVVEELKSIAEKRGLSTEGIMPDDPTPNDPFSPTM